MNLATAEEWRAHSSWYRRTLTADRVGEIFAYDPRTLPLLPGFLTVHPPSRVDPTPWSLADIYDYFCEHTRFQTSMIPRLYPLPNHPGGPARMLFTKAIEIGPGGQEFVVHAWDPPDGRGHIAIGYPVRDCPDAATAQAARRLHAQLSWASAVVIPANESARLGRRYWQPTVWVADGRGAGIWTRIEGIAGVERAVWADVANLLRITLPWWPRGLRERDAMLMWRPGDDPLAIPPGTADRDPVALLDVLAPDSSAGLRHTVAAMVREIEHELCGDFQAGRDRYSPFPGLTHAAFPSLDPQPPRSRTAGETALFLHQEVANPLIAARAAAVAGGHPIAHLAYVINPDNRDHTLITEWLGRLRPATRRDEIGFQLALSMLPAEMRPGDHLAPTGFHIDPELPACWVVSAGETVIVTCGTSVPARGVLRQAYLADGVAFFLDSTGKTWPLPYPQSTANTDETMAQTLSRLMIDAGADVDDPGSAVATNPLVLQQLWDTPLPMVVNADDVHRSR